MPPAKASSVAQTTSRLASGAMREKEPNRKTRMGSTKTCAVSVVASIVTGSEISRLTGHGSMRKGFIMAARKRAPYRVSPSVEKKDSHSPASCTA